MIKHFKEAPRQPENTTRTLKRNVDISGADHQTPDAKAEANADRAARSGAWQEFAQPGYELSAAGIAVDALAEAHRHEIEVQQPKSPAKAIEVHTTSQG